MKLGFTREVNRYGESYVRAINADSGEVIDNEKACTVESSIDGPTIVTLRYVVLRPVERKD